MRMWVLTFLNLFPREDIGTPETGTYLTRWVLLGLFGYRVYLHWFRQSDASRCLHDHPNSVLSLMLKGKYIERLPGGAVREYKAPCLRWFPAEHCHRVELPDGYEDKTWTLCLFLRKRRPWGFWVKGQWVGWRDYFTKFGGTGGCD